MNLFIVCFCTYGFLKSFILSVPEINTFKMYAVSEIDAPELPLPSFGVLPGPAEASPLARGSHWPLHGRQSVA